jgi:hypothetical protein
MNKVFINKKAVCLATKVINYWTACNKGKVYLF